MNVGDLLQRLSYGELINLALGQDGSGTVVNRDQNRVISYANSALVELYSRFKHKTDFVDVMLLTGVKRYLLTSTNSVSYALSNPGGLVYVIDTEIEPFQDDVVRILEITSQATDPVVAAEILQSIRVLSNDTLYVKEPTNGALVTVEYQAKHKKLSIPPVLTETITLIPLLETALELRIAASVYSTMNGEANVAKSQLLMAQFETILSQVKIEDLVRETEDLDTERLVLNGWV